MNLDKFLVIAGVPGVHKLVSTRSNGLVIEDRQEGRTRFVPVRQQQVTPLATIAIYTDTEEGTVTLTDVFQKMLDQLETNPPVASDSNSAQFRAYFTTILPEHDQERVHINDIKKCIKWFNFMIDKGIFEEVKKEAESTETEAKVDVANAETETTANVAETETTTEKATTETTTETPETEA